MNVCIAIWCIKNIKNTTLTTYIRTNNLVKSQPNTKKNHKSDIMDTNMYRVNAIIRIMDRIYPCAWIRQEIFCCWKVIYQIQNRIQHKILWKTNIKFQINGLHACVPEIILYTCSCILSLEYFGYNFRITL